MMYIHNTSQNNHLSFVSFVLSQITLSVIAGLFTYRLIGSLLDNIILPLLDLSILPVKKFNKLTRVYDNKKNPVNGLFKTKEYKYIIQPGIFIRDLILWCTIMLLLYIIYRITKN